MSCSDDEVEVSISPKTDEDRVRMWASTMKLNNRTADELIRLGFDTMEAVSTIEKEDMPSFNIPLGQQKVLLKAVNKTFVTNDVTLDEAMGGAISAGDTENNRDGDWTQPKISEGCDNNSGPDQVFVNEVLRMMSKHQSSSHQNEHKETSITNTSNQTGTGNLITAPSMVPRGMIHNSCWKLQLSIKGFSI